MQHISVTTYSSLTTSLASLSPAPRRISITHNDTRLSVCLSLTCTAMCSVSSNRLAECHPHDASALSTTTHVCLSVCLSHALQCALCLLTDLQNVMHCLKTDMIDIQMPRRRTSSRTYDDTRTLLLLPTPVIDHQFIERHSAYVSHNLSYRV